MASRDDKRAFHQSEDPTGSKHLEMLAKQRSRVGVDSHRTNLDESNIFAGILKPMTHEKVRFHQPDSSRGEHSTTREESTIHSPTVHHGKGIALASPTFQYPGTEQLEPGAEFVPWGDYGPPRRVPQESRPSQPQPPPPTPPSPPQQANEPVSVSHEIAYPEQPSQSNHTATTGIIFDLEQAALADADKPTSQGSRSKRCLLIVAATILLLIAVALAVGFSVFRRKSSHDEVVTTPMELPSFSCQDLSSQKQPSVITQCFCLGKITIVADDVQANYRRLKSEGYIQKILPAFGSTLDSCDPTNQALVWLASGTGTPSATANLHQRYILALLFITWNGQKWQVNKGWQTSENECTWTGVTCDANGVVVNIMLHDNGVTGKLGSEISLLTSLTFLELDQNKVQGSLASELSSLVNLQVLMLENNQLTGTLPDTLRMLTALQELHLGYNSLSGTIPTWIGQLQGLSTLSLSNNTLTQFTKKSPPIPTELGLLTNLKTLELSKIGMNGTLPTELFNLGNSLQLLDVSGNSLSGTIPSLFGQLTLLEEVALNQNSFTGTIPPEFSQCTDLSSLDLSKNNLNGTMPNALTALSKLVDLAVNGNPLSGTIPSGFCTIPKLSLCQFGDVSCRCCICP